MTNKIMVFLTILVFSTLNLSAQERRNDSISSSRFSISSVSLFAGPYSPSMDFWNDTFFKDANTDDGFQRGILYGCNIAFDLPLNLGARAGIWHWGEQVSGQDGGSFNTLNVNFTGLSLGAFYKYRKGIYWDMKPYVGVDGSFLMIQDKYNVSGNENKKSGYDVVYTPFIGVDRVFNNHIVLGIEFGYFIGSYNQDLLLNSGATSAKISINGAKIQLSVGYKFP
jgi:hypothetical protein